jgi:hypothetical protein
MKRVRMAISSKSSGRSTSGSIASIRARNAFRLAGSSSASSFSRSILVWATSKIGWSRRSPSSVREYAASSSSLSMLTNASGLSGSLSEVRVSARDTVHARSESSTDLGSPQRSERPTNTSRRCRASRSSSSAQNAYARRLIWPGLGSTSRRQARRDDARRDVARVKLALVLDPFERLDC